MQAIPTLDVFITVFALSSFLARRSSRTAIFRTMKLECIIIVYTHGRERKKKIDRETLQVFRVEIL